MFQESLLNKRFLNRIRGHYLMANVLRRLATPIERFCAAVSRQIRMKVWVNGEAVRYGDLTLRFPRDVGVNYCSNIYWKGVEGFEPVTWNVIRHVLGSADTFVDVGSNIGFYSVLSKMVYPGVDVLAFEPVPTIFQKNVAFHEVNGIESSHVVNAAIGASSGTAEIYLPIVEEALEEGMTATLRRDSWQFGHRHETFEVETRTLDDTLAHLAPGTRLFIKIDVEDYELGVFQGASWVMETLRPIIVCEILPRDHGNQETVELFEAQGYVAYGIARDCLVRFRREDFKGQRKIRDFLLLPPDLQPEALHLGYGDLDKLGWPAR